MELDYIGSIFNFSNFKDINFKDHIIAFINEDHGITHESNETGKIRKLFESNQNLQIICSSKEDEYGSILILIPISNSYFSIYYEDCTYALMQFEISELCGTANSNYISHIDSVKFSISQIQAKISKVNSNIKNTDKKIKKLESALKTVHTSNNTISLELNANKSHIRNLYNHFEELSHEEVNTNVSLRCIFCNLNLKSILYKPCGHLAICHNCLIQNLNQFSNNPRKGAKNQLLCQLCKERVLETVIVHLQS